MAEDDDGYKLVTKAHKKIMCTLAVISTMNAGITKEVIPKSGKFIYI
jgi:hypothetical protein